MELTDQACRAAAAAAAAQAVLAVQWQATTGLVALTCTILISWPQACLTAAAVALPTLQLPSRKNIWCVSLQLYVLETYRQRELHPAAAQMSSVRAAV